MDTTESDSDVPVSQIKILWGILGTIGVVLLVIVAFVFSKLIDERHRERQAMVPVNEQIQQVRQLLLAVRTYAADNDDNFPDILQQVIDEGYVDDLDLLETNFTLYGDREPFLYRPGYTAIGFSRTPLIISPESPRTGRRVVGYIGGSVAEVSMTNADVEKLLAEEPGGKP